MSNTLELLSFFSVCYVFKGRNKGKIRQWEMWDKLNNSGYHEPHL